jgi:hypothetical protein
MSEQLDIFVTPQQAKARAIERVECNNREFVDGATEVIERLSHEQKSFTALDVWAKYQGVMPHHPRAMGAAFVRAQNAGWIVPTNRWVKSGRVSDHNQMLRVWESVRI